ncbi:MAG TPA: hypothetical protein VMV18_01000, partial [bacterium]|nr:hypothetical protein [bacterium]
PRAPAGGGGTKTAGGGTKTGTGSGTASAGTGSAEPAGLNGPKKYAYVTVPKTNVLLNANDSSPTLAVANRNEVFEVGGFSRDKTYVKVRTEDGRVGWIAKTDLHPGKPEVAVAKNDKPRPRHVEEDNPRPHPTPEDTPPPPRRGRMASASGEGDTRIWADGGALIFHEKMTSDQGYGYDLNGTGFGGGVRFEHRISGGFGIEGGYLGMVNQRLPAKAANTSISASTHRIDFSARYKLEFTDEQGPSITVLAGFQNVTFYVQPQSLDFFYSQIYNSGAVGIGGEYPFGQIRVAADYRYFTPVLGGERYGNGAKGADGQSVKSAGIGFGVGLRYVFYSGAQFGLNIRGYNYASNWSGTGIRGVANPLGPGVATVKVTGVQVLDQFDTVTLTFARGF